LLLFWQAVLQFAFAPPPAWDLAFCKQLLAGHASAIGQTELVPQAGDNRTFRAAGTLYAEAEVVDFLAEGVEDIVLKCEAAISSAASRAGEVGDSYACPSTNVAYASESADNWLRTTVRIENTLPGIPTPFTTLITYYNPAAPQAFEARLAALRAHECVI
jgi:hypothetical protein